MSPTRESQEPTQRSDGTKIACIGLISAVIVAIIGLIGVLGAPIIAEFAKSLFAPTTTPTPTKTPATVLSPTITDTPTPTPYYVEIVVMPPSG
ncbi:MAG: hypothetical protein GTN71_23565 [Anaerolineae bacterium]|nr:hypothetical protein [Anaerolineae bacterium]